YSTTNAAIVVPKPGSNTIYYIFTADAIEHANAFGYNFSEVDMTLNGGLGDITVNKNVLLYAPCTEKLTATRAANGIDVWVITKDWGNNQWRVFKVDCNGVNTNPVVSNAGASHDEVIMGYRAGASGGARVSPDGRLLAGTRPAARAWELFHFDNATGIISDALSFNASFVYGVEFSPNSKLIYLNSTSNNSNISQFDISVYNAAVIQASEIAVGSPILASGALQLGPDNKIYCAKAFSIGSSSLGVINAPDARGLACNYNDTQIDLLHGVSQYGLPAFMADLVVNPRTDFTYMADNVHCGTMNFTGSSRLNSPLGWQWDFGDGTTAAGQSVSHQFTPGDTVLVRLTVNATTICGGTITSTKKVVIPGPKPTGGFNNNGNCLHTPIAFTDTSAIARGSINSWYWDFGDGSSSLLQNPVHSYRAGGNYLVKQVVSSATGCPADTIKKNILVESGPVIDFTFGNTCIGRETRFTNRSSNQFGPIVSWKWDFGNGDSSAAFEPVATYTRYGNYTVSLLASTQNGCMTTGTKTVTIAPVVVNAGNDTTAAPGQPLQLQATGAVSYTWSPGTGLDNPFSDHPLAHPPADIVYHLTGITAQGCTGYDSLQVKVYKGPAVYVPNAFTPNGDGTNEVLRPIVPGIQKLDYFSVYNRAGRLVFSSSTPGKGWDGTLNGIPQPPGTYVWIIQMHDYLGQAQRQKGVVILLR
ncbi:MAG TPA: PKD domain-containing protein, partial [Chitinophagaceae bacterium]|nr:PKD domain-containing protein [Chitinophagaceae bacterium]